MPAIIALKSRGKTLFRSRICNLVEILCVLSATQKLSSIRFSWRYLAKSR